MIATFESKGWRDFAQRYATTYGWYHTDSGKKVLVRVDEVNERTVQFVDKDEMRYSAVCDKGNIFEFIPAERGVHNLSNGDVVIAERIAARQWKRGLCRDNTSFISLSGQGRIDFTFEVIEEIFSPKPYLAELDSFIEGKRDCVALNPFISFIKHRVFVYDRHEGNLSKKDKTITMVNPTYSQEVRDIVRDSFLDYIVVEK
jgi:hypothetical protein